jgi:hypothetical protein
MGLTEGVNSVSSFVKLEAEQSVYRLMVSSKTLPFEFRFRFSYPISDRPITTWSKKKRSTPEMKKLTSALALVALATSLVACSKPEEKKPEMKTEAPKVVEETAKTTTTVTTGTAPDAAVAGTATTATTTTTTSMTTTTSVPAKK